MSENNPSNLPAVRPETPVAVILPQQTSQQNNFSNGQQNTRQNGIPNVPPRVAQTPPKAEQPKYKRPEETQKPPVKEQEKEQETEDKGVTKDDIEFLTDKFSKNMESIGTILKTSVNAQNKAFKHELDQVDRTYNNFVKTTKEQADVLNGASEEQKDVFKNLTDQFIRFREDETADAGKFHDEMIASLHDIHAAGGPEEVTAALEKIARDAMATTQVDPDREKFDKKWVLSDKEKDSWANKLFGYKQPESEITPEDKAIASGQAEFKQKGLFKDQKVVTEKTPIEKMLETFLKESTEKKEGKTSRKVGKDGDEQIEKLTINKLIVDKFGGRLGEMFDRMGKDTDKVKHKRKKPDEVLDAEGNKRSTRTKKDNDIEDVEFTEHERPEKKPKLLDYEDVDFTEHENKPEVKPSAPLLLAAPIKNTESIIEAEPLKPSAPIKNTEKLEPEVKPYGPIKSPMAKAIQSAMSEYKPTLEKPEHTIATAVTQARPLGKNIEPSEHNAPALPAPLALPAIASVAPQIGNDVALSKDTPSTPEKEKSDDNDDGGIVSTLMDKGTDKLMDMIPKGKAGGMMGKIGGMLGDVGEMAGKVAAPLAAGMSAVNGVSDIANGGTVDSIIPKGGLLDKLNPFEYAMNAGRMGGQAIEGGIEKLTGGQSLGSKVYDWTHPDANPVAPGKELKALSDDAQSTKAAQKAAPVVVHAPAPQKAAAAAPVAPPSNTTNYMAVSANPRNRENYFDRVMGKTFTAV